MKACNDTAKPQNGRKRRDDRPTERGTLSPRDQESAGKELFCAPSADLAGSLASIAPAM